MFFEELAAEAGVVGGGGDDAELGMFGEGDAGLDAHRPVVLASGAVVRQGFERGVRVDPVSGPAQVDDGACGAVLSPVGLVVEGVEGGVAGDGVEVEAFEHPAAGGLVLGVGGGDAVLGVVPDGDVGEGVVFGGGHGGSIREGRERGGGQR
ncbi:hypothetical protein [Streptomyces sp. NPDC057617]|uniref:hypothetical protein n=1 Tax=Streptomyces sp. NPDC057617 TaxID=3346184 RepID=UPI0036BDE5E6